MSSRFKWKWWKEKTQTNTRVSDTIGNISLSFKNMNLYRETAELKLKIKQIKE